jgi:ATP/maltotriose-dependent transcriptional regulator MalT/DNA-binding SARP family transcriptional activator
MGLGPRLQTPHVARQRLVDAVASARVALVAAPSGYGKTALSAEVAHAVGCASANAPLAAGDRDGAALVARLVSALWRAQLSDPATATQSERADPPAAVDALCTALARARDPILLIVDDAHHVDLDGGRLLARLAGQLPVGHRLLILARHMPAGLQLGATIVTVGGDRLAFTSAEVETLLKTRFDVTIGDAQADELRRATGGWAAALVLAGEALARAEDRDAEITAIVRGRAPLRRLVERQLEGMGAGDRGVVVQLAHLPLLAAAIVEAVSGDGALLGRLGASGIPVGERPDGWWEMPGPVQELVARFAPLAADTALLAAPVYAQRGEVSAAVKLLLSASCAEEAVAMLSRLTPEEAETIGYLEFQTLIDSIPPAAVERHPGALLHLARTCEATARVRRRSDALDHARSLAVLTQDTVLERALDAEIARDLIRDERPSEAESLALGVLAHAEAGELATRARALGVLGQAAAWRRDITSLVTAQRQLQESYELCLQVGQPGWASQMAGMLGIVVFYARGDFDSALRWVELALEGMASRTTYRAVVLTFYADVLVNCGRFTDAEAAIDEARAVGELLTDDRVCAYAHWSGARLASQRGDRGQTLSELLAAEAHVDDWFDHPTGVDFLADAADLLDRVGDTDRALTYLERARPQRDAEPVAFGTAEGAVLARSGDPDAARVALDRLAGLRIEPRERWRITLLAAYAALRAGDPSAGHLAADAFELAGALGRPELPMVRERALAERLVGLAAAGGSVAAAALQEVSPRLTVRLLGGFELRRGGATLSLPPGRPELLVKLLACHGGRLPAEQTIELLWPEVAPQSGRKRLRNVLNRLQASAPAVVSRDGEVLSLGDVEVDAELFEYGARRALAASHASTARIAIAQYRGPVLPDDPFEPWAADSRERLERLFIDLLDAAAAQAELAGEVDEAVRLIDRALELDPSDEDRCHRGAALLLSQGRRSAALALLTRGARALDSLGVPTSAHHHELMAAARGEAASV